ncbi:hypothetical protein KUTG_01972 [Kutzneria sp. 744]|nr:hypothetical protein KUTG_01972 [Kutzneria sp. 744]
MAESGHDRRRGLTRCRRVRCGRSPLPEVAAALDTGQASLYRHIADRQGLLSLLADEIAAALPLPDPVLPPAERLPAAWLAMHDHLASHPWAARVVVDGRLLSHDHVMVTQALTAAFEAYGLSRDDAGRAYRALFNLTFGRLLNRHPRPQRGRLRLGRAPLPRRSRLILTAYSYAPA